jgi:hypothetical protein
MDDAHRRHHLKDLAGRRFFLRTLRPDGERYKLWLGDLVEFVNVAYGPDSPQMTEVQNALRAHPRLPSAAPEDARVRDYLDRLETLGALLDRLERDAIESDPAEQSGR